MTDAVDAIARLTEDFRRMLLIRRFEEKAGQLYGMGEIAGFCHLAIGQEAIAVGVRNALTDGDKVIASYRNHHHALASGIEPRALMAELTGRAAGVCGGHGGSMHVFDVATGFFGGQGMVGAPASVGVGLAFADAYRNQKTVTVAFIGDRATAQGQVHEALGLARRLTLPLVLICENNGEDDGAEDAPSLAALGASHNVEAEQVDGAKVDDVAACAAAAIERCRGGAGPSIIEARTVRYRGHSMANPARYRSKTAINAPSRTADPIAYVRDLLLGHAVEEQALATIEQAVRAKVNEAAEYALSMPAPTVEAEVVS